MQRPTGVSQRPLLRQHWSRLDEPTLTALPFVLAESSSAFLASGKVDDHKKKNRQWKCVIRHSRVDRVKWENALFPGFWRP